MHEVLASLEAFQRRAADVFDRVEAAVARADDRLGSLENRLEGAAARLEAARGGTRPLVVKSVRSIGGAAFGEPVRGSQRPFGVLKHPCRVTPLHEEANASWSPPSVQDAAEDLARVVKSVAAAVADTGASTTKSRGDSKLLPPRGRLGGVGDLFLFNSGEIPYKGCNSFTDNLIRLADEERAIALPSKQTQDTTTDAHRGAWLRLQEDEPDPLREDLRFRPSTAAEVVFDLPDVLPELEGSVAALLWRQQDHSAVETDRPAWDAPPPMLTSSLPTSTTRGLAARAPPQAEGRGVDVGDGRRSRAPATVAQRTASKQHQASMPQPPPPKAAAPPQEARVSSTPTVAQDVHKAAPRAPPPPPAAKGKGKGKATPPPPAPKEKGKGKGKPKPPPPPPPAKGAGKSKPAPPPKKAGGDSGGMSKVFADIRKGGMTGLRKIGPPKERSGAPVGRVVS